MVKSETDYILWLKVDKKCSPGNVDLYIGAVYIPLCNSTYSVNPYDTIQEEICKFN